MQSVCHQSTILVYVWVAILAVTEIIENESYV